MGRIKKGLLNISNFIGFFAKNHWINWLLLAAFFSSALTPFSEPSSPELEERGYARIPTASQIVLTGEDILGGHGVSVVYQTRGPLDYSGYLPFQYQCTAGGCFQCIEFVLWLYDRQLGYPYKWPGEIWSPYQLIGVVQTAAQVDYQAETGLLSTESAQYKLYEPYSDLRYYPNGSATPPQPGDILISADGGHSMVVNRTGGDQLEIVQQNAWEIIADPQPSALEIRQVYSSAGVYSVQNGMGWIHSPRWEEKFAQKEAVQASGESIQWTRTTSGLTVHLSGDYVQKLAAGPLGETPYLTVRKLANSGALQFTNQDYLTCVLRQLAALLNSHANLAGAAELNVNIPYFGSSLSIQTPGADPADYVIEICGWDG
jgi:hypothetical protein